MSKTETVRNLYDSLFDLLDINDDGMIEKQEIIDSVNVLIVYQEELRMLPIRFLLDKTWMVFDRDNKG